jgi:hypothetical protein
MRAGCQAELNIFSGGGGGNKNIQKGPPRRLTGLLILHAVRTVLASDNAVGAALEAHAYVQHPLTAQPIRQCGLGWWTSHRLADPVQAILEDFQHRYTL